jgi:hypothetical protein
MISAKLGIGLVVGGCVDFIVFFLYAYIKHGYLVAEAYRRIKRMEREDPAVMAINRKYGEEWKVKDLTAEEQESIWDFRKELHKLIAEVPIWDFRKELHKLI